MSNLIRVGDRTVVGGVVVDGAGCVSMDGRALSFNGAGVSCAQCGSVGFARSILPHSTNVVMNGRQLLQAGDQCVCKCSSPALVASQGIVSLNAGSSYPVATFNASGSMSLRDAQPFGYYEDIQDGDTAKVAGTTNEKYARKMFGYSNSAFREMIHRFKKTNGIGPNDDLEFEENGDIYFNGDYIDNFHAYDN